MRPPKPARCRATPPSEMPIRVYRPLLCRAITHRFVPWASKSSCGSRVTGPHRWKTVPFLQRSIGFDVSFPAATTHGESSKARKGFPAATSVVTCESQHFPRGITHEDRSHRRSRSRRRCRPLRRRLRQGPGSGSGRRQGLIATRQPHPRLEARVRTRRSPTGRGTDGTIGASSLFGRLADRSHFTGPAGRRRTRKRGNP